MYNDAAASPMGSFPAAALLFHWARRESTMFIREACTEGSKPPTKPMPREKARAFQEISQVRVKEKASSEKVWKFMVEMVMSCMKDARKIPAPPPIKPTPWSHFLVRGRLPRRRRPCRRPP